MASIWITVLLSVAAGALLAALKVRRDRALSRHRQVFNRLALPDVSGDVFHARETALLPPPAARYLRHAIRDRAPLAKTVDLHLLGEMRVREDGDWFKFEAMERICPERGFLWQGRIEGLGRVSAEGAEYFSGGRAASEFFFGGLLPLVKVHDGEFGRSSAGRLLIESIWLPACLTPDRGALWHPGDDHRCTVRLPGQAEITSLNMTVAESGALIDVSMMRHQGGEANNFGLMPFGIRVEKEKQFGDFTVPSEVSAIWGYGTDDADEFMRIKVEDARFL
ncbi:MAG: hypothetical protein PVI08_09685 [Gammaproteobacteria bacterium]|jgi:hypothetical protein